MEHPEHVWFLMSRSLSGEATAQENEELLSVLQKEPALMQQYELLKSLWTAGNANEQNKIGSEKISHILQLSAVEEALNKGQEFMPTKRLRVLWKPYRWAAVWVGIAILAAGLVIWGLNQNRLTPREVIAQKGSKTRTILPDGSTVWLNAGSKIVYGPEFNMKTRDITLYGEAYFDVVKEPAKPFIVHAGQLDIKVLGTVFNVKSYPEDKTTETTLIRGLVQITMPNAKQAPIYLHPNQKIILPQVNMAGVKPTSGGKAQKDISAITYLDTSLKENERIETAWVYNRLEFRGDSFAELAKKLERWYNVTIHFEDERVRQFTFNGSLENETVSQAFHALQAANSFNFKIKDNEIFISSF